VQYLKLGFSVIPLRGKIPAVTWREYQRRRVTLVELRRWVRRELFSNVGIVCGKVSGNLAVLDFDTADAYDDFRARFPEVAKTTTIATGGGGWHVYLRVDALPPSLRGQGVELCANGRQVVASPSVHPVTGKPYRLALPLDIRHVLDLSKVKEWVETSRRSARSRGPVGEREHITPVSRWTTAVVSTTLVAAIADTLRVRGYRQKGDWLNGPCIYPHHHSHNDSKTSFGFNARTGYGNCFRCGSILAKDVARTIGIDPVP